MPFIFRLGQCILQPKVYCRLCIGLQHSAEMAISGWHRKALMALDPESLTNWRSANKTIMGGRGRRKWNNVPLFPMGGSDCLYPHIACVIWTSRTLELNGHNQVSQFVTDKKHSEVFMLENAEQWYHFIYLQQENSYNLRIFINITAEIVLAIFHLLSTMSNNFFEY